MNLLAGLGALLLSAGGRDLGFAHDRTIDSADIFQISAAADQLARRAIRVYDAIDERPLLDVALVAGLGSQADRGDHSADLLVSLAFHPAIEIAEVKVDVPNAFAGRLFLCHAN